jgi:branched-chain amino acid transport system substrate-binding protein
MVKPAAWIPIALLVATSIALGWWLLHSRPPITIGAVLPTTGEYARFGGSVARGIGLALDEVNRSGGVRRQPVEVDVEDSARAPALGVAAARKLISERGVPAIIGAMGSNVTLAMARVVEENGTVLLSPASSAPAISKAGEFVFRNYPSDALEAQQLGRFAFEKGCTSGALLVANSGDGPVLAHAFEMTLRSLGGEIVFDERFEAGTTDFSERISRLAAAEPGCAFLVGENRDLRSILRESRASGLLVPFYSPVIFHEDDTVVREAQPVRGVVFSTPTFDASSSEPRVAEFTRAFREKFGEDPDIWAAHGYDALHLLVEAMRTNGTSGEEIRDGLYALRGYVGAAGETTFDANGDVLRGGTFMTVRNGELVLLEE